MNPFLLEGRRIAITGAAGGIGQAAGRLALELGAEVILSDREAPNELAEELGSGGKPVTAVALDVSDRAAVEAWVAGAGEIDALVDCAAICPFDDWDDEGWDDMAGRVFDINLGGPINLCRAVLPGMMARGAGRIALVGSIAGRIGGVRSAPHYVMSKGGLHAFVRWAAKRGAPRGVTVNAVAPGVVDTPMTANQAFDYSALPLGRKASADEIAAPLLFLVSDAAGYVNGAVLDVNSGMHFS